MTFLVFLAALLLDFLAASWTISANSGQWARASLYSGLCSLLGFATVYLCIQDYGMLVPATAGHMVGTALAVKFIRRKV